MGVGGPVAWNFEKFVVSADPADGSEPKIVRFRSTTEPQDESIRAAITEALG
jgi:glutathione peroxidase